MKKQKRDQSHLTLTDREVIQKGIENRCRKVDIAKTIGKDPTTVAKEIRKHRIFKPRNTLTRPSICVNRQVCGGCKSICERYEMLQMLIRLTTMN